MTLARNEFIDQIDNAVRQHFGDNDEVPSEDEVREMYEQLYDAFSALPMYKGMAGNRDETVKTLVHQYCSELSITKKFGFAFKDDEAKPWLTEAEDEIETARRPAGQGRPALRQPPAAPRGADVHRRRDLRRASP